MFKDWVIFVFLMVLIIDVDFVDEVIGDDVCDNWVEVKVVVVEFVFDVVGVFDGELYVIFRLLFFNLFEV